MVAKEPKAAATTPEGAAPAKPAAKRKKEFKKKRERRVVPHGLVYVAASFNNTQITITDLDGRTMCWSSADRKSTRLNSSHSQISYAVFCLKKKKNTTLLL